MENVIGDDQFSKADVKDVNWTKINQILADRDPKVKLDQRDGWRESAIKIRVPLGALDSSESFKEFEIRGVMYRPLEEVVRKAFEQPAAKQYHFEPFELYWQNPDDPSAVPERVHGEAYTSPAFAQAHKEVLDLPAEPDCTLPRAIAACMGYSDATHLAQFGTASLWPGYISHGNQSKYARANPLDTTAHHHLVYFPSVRVLLIPSSRH